MAEKIIKTKIALRWLDYATWSAEAFQTEKPLKGEVWFCEVPTGNANAQTAPTMLFKVGDGVNTFGTLKWASALAADVYDWAKVAGGNVFAKEGAGNVISGIVYDAELNNGKGGFKYTTASVATAEGLEELQKEVYGENGSANDSRIDKLEKDIADNREAWNKYEDTRYTFSTDGDKLVVKKTLYTNGVAGTEEEVGTYEFLTVDEVNGILADYYTKTDLEGKIHTEEEIKAMEIAHATAAGKVDNALTIKVGGADVVFDGSAAQTADVDTAINAAIDAAKVDYTVTCDDTDHEATENTPAFKRHTLTQNGKQVCVIDVPRDLVIKSGSVDKENNELVLVLVNDEEIRVDVSHLIEYVTGGTAVDGIITVDVDDNFVATATINDGTVTEAKLHTDVAAKLNKVWDAEGAAATAEQNAKDYADGLVAGYGDIVTHNAAEFATNAENGAKVLADQNKLAIDAINNVDTGILAQAKKDAADKAAVVLNEAQKYADGKIDGLHTIATTGSIYDVEECNTDENGVTYFILDCNW